MRLPESRSIFAAGQIDADVALNYSHTGFQGGA
jgi:hypothetical protein